MANPTFSNNTFAGEALIELFGPAVIDPTGLGDVGMATLHEDVKFKKVIQDIDDTIVFQTPSTTFNKQSTTSDIDEVVLEVTPYEFHQTFDFNAVRTNWLSRGLQRGSMNDYQDPNDPSIITAFLNEVYMPKIKALNSFLQLSGKVGADATVGAISFAAAYTGLYERIIAAATNKYKAKISALAISAVTKGTTTLLTVGTTANLRDGDVVSIVGALGTGWVTALNGNFQVVSIPSATSVEINLDSDALTSNQYTASSAEVQFINETNIIDVLRKFYNRIPYKVRQIRVENGGGKFVLPRHLEAAWNFANAIVSQNQANYFRGSYGNTFIDKEIVFVDDAPLNTVGYWLPKNVHMGCDLVSDENQLQVIFQGDKTLDMNYRMRGRMNTGNIINFPDQITLYYPAK